MDFNSVLNVKASDIERPPMIPVGTYRAKVKKIPEVGERSSDKGNWDTLDFQMQLVEPGDDVNSEELAKYGNLNAAVRRRGFMFDKNDKGSFDRTLFQLKQFLLIHLKVDGSDDTPLKELINNSIGQECQVFIRWRPDPNDKEVMYDEIGKTLPIA